MGHMNRRELIKQSVKGVLGIGGMVLGVKATEPIPKDMAITNTLYPDSPPNEIHIFLHADSPRGFNDRVMAAVAEDIKSNGRIRQMIVGLDDRPWQ